MGRRPSEIDREFQAAEREAFAEQAQRFRALTDEERRAYFLRDQEGFRLKPEALEAHHE